LNGWKQVGNANWELGDGTVRADAGTGFLLTEAVYDDFDLDLFHIGHHHGTPPTSPRVLSRATVLSTASRCRACSGTRLPHCQL